MQRKERMQRKESEEGTAAKIQNGVGPVCLTKKKKKSCKSGYVVDTSQRGMSTPIHDQENCIGAGGKRKERKRKERQ